MWLLLPFVVLPIIEIALFIQVGSAIGVLPVIALVLASAFAGVAIMRRQGARAALDVQQAMREVGDPTRPMAHGALRMIGAVLMVVPGLFTSALGLLLQLPPLRDLILRRMAARMRVSGAGFSYGPQSHGSQTGFGGYPPRPRRDDGVIDGEYSVQDDPPAPVRDGLTDQSAGDQGGEGGPRRGNSGWTRH
ncbi:FxsA family protein [Paracoccus sp. (in: a-proteobacteria)]|uniref:FxsA family protein n=1 Tax=Paracoccus sp. TaxID=267 RepID=UPI0035B2B2D9